MGIDLSVDRVAEMDKVNRLIYVINMHKNNFSIKAALKFTSRFILKIRTSNKPGYLRCR
jgi:hypothetical protein